MNVTRNKQTISIEWAQGDTREVDVILNTWFLGVYTKEVLAVAGSIDDAIERSAHYQRDYGIEGKITHEVRPPKKLYKEFRK